MQEYRRIRIADLNISIRSREDKLSGLGIDEEGRFFSKSPPDIILEVRAVEASKVSGKKIFDSEGAWALYKNPRHYILRIPASPRRVSRLLFLNSNLNRGKLYLNKSPGGRAPLPLEHPLGQILLTLWLSQNGGLTVHACGIEKDGKGMLFLGSSGSGKSTMAALWSKEKGVTILSDERVIIREHKKFFYIYGTPWAGTAKFSSPQAAPLKKIFFIKPNKKNSLSLLKPSLALGQAIVHSYLPIWDKKGMAKTINLLAGLFDTLPSYNLGFRPDKQIISLIGNLS